MEEHGTTLPAIRLIRAASVLLLVSVPVCDVLEGIAPSAPWSMVGFIALTLGLTIAIVRWSLGWVRLHHAPVKPEFRILSWVIHGSRSVILLLFLTSWLLRLSMPHVAASSAASALALLGAILSTTGAWIVHEATASRTRLQSPARGM